MRDLEYITQLIRLPGHRFPFQLYFLNYALMENEQVTLTFDMPRNGVYSLATPWGVLQPIGPQ